MYFIAYSVIVAGLAVSLASAASGQVGNPALTQTPVTTQEIARTYNAFRLPRYKSAAAELDGLCASKRRRDQRRCDRAWKKIQVAYAQLQAKKARVQSQQH